MRLAVLHTHAALNAAAKRHPSAGVLDEEDGYGEGATMEDYVTHGDVEDYEGGWWGCCAAALVVGLFWSVGPLGSQRVPSRL